MPTELPFDPNKVPELIKQGRIKVVAAPSAPIPTTPTEQPAVADRMAERAKDLLGKDFLGLEAIRTMEAKLRSAGTDVEFDLGNIPSLACNEKDLEIAKENGEMLILRAAQVSIQDSEVHVANLGRRNPQPFIPITLMNFRELFRQDPTGNISTLFYTFRPNANDWYPAEDFAKLAGEIKLEWAFVKKEVLNGSTSKKWDQQDDLLEKYGKDIDKKGVSRSDVRRRTAMEVVWDTMLYYTTLN